MRKGQYAALQNNVRSRHVLWQNASELHREVKYEEDPVDIGIIKRSYPPQFIEFKSCAVKDLLASPQSFDKHWYW